MRNDEIAAHLYELASRLEFVAARAGIYKVMAYRRAAKTVTNCSQSIEHMVSEGRVNELPGVGAAISAKLTELLDTGSIAALETLRERVPSGLIRLAGLPGVSRALAERIWTSLEAETLEDVERALDDGRLLTVPGIGAKTVEKLRESFRGGALPARRIELLRSDVEECADAARNLVAVALPGSIVVLGGRYARGAELSDHVDIGIAAASGAAVDKLAATALDRGWVVDRDDVVATIGLIAPSGTRVNAYIEPADRGAVAMLRAVGPEHHADAVIARAGSVPCPLQQGPEGDRELYSAAELHWLPPELRDRPDAMTIAQEGTPALVSEADVRADLHLHTDWTDGRATILQMAEAARARGDSHMVITDHSYSLRMVGGLSPDELRRQWLEIDQAQAELGDSFRILRGIEVEILLDGQLDFPEALLAELDWVVASVHVGQRQTTAELMARIETALQCRYVDCIAHPTGRLLGRRPPADVDLEVLIDRAAQTGTVLEINGSPDRLDLSADAARQALAAGVRLAVNSDAHRTRTLGLRRHAVAVARRAGARADHVVNCLEWPELLASRKREQA